MAEKNNWVAETIKNDFPAEIMFLSRWARIPKALRVPLLREPHKALRAYVRAAARDHVRATLLRIPKSLRVRLQARTPKALRVLLLRESLQRCACISGPRPAII